MVGDPCQEVALPWEEEEIHHVEEALEAEVDASSHEAELQKGEGGCGVEGGGGASAKSW